MSDGNADGRFRFSALPNGWTVGRFDVLEEIDSVVHLVTTRVGFDPDDAPSGRPALVEQVSAALGLREVAFCRQVHGKMVIAADHGGQLGQADAIITNVASLGLMGFSADCPLILAAEPVSGAIGMAHASWRGTVGRIGSELVVHMASRFGCEPAGIVACICPSAGPCCYQVGQDVFDAAVGGIGRYAERFFARRNGRMFFDLWAANKDELIRAGLEPENIHVSGICTVCRNDLFPSVRAEGESAERFVAVIARK